MPSTGCSSRSTCTRPRCPISSRCASGIRRCATRSSSASARYVASYCDSELARRVAACARVDKERHFTFEHDGVLLHGFLDVLHLDGPRALVVDYKTNLIGESTPEDIVEADYGLQRLVYALACFRAGAEEVEVVYHFLERPDAVVSTTFTARQDRGARGGALGGHRTDPCRRVPADAERVRCARCPALDLVCAGPRLAPAADAAYRQRRLRCTRSV